MKPRRSEQCELITGAVENLKLLSPLPKGVKNESVLDESKTEEIGKKYSFKNKLLL